MSAQCPLSQYLYREVLTLPSTKKTSPPLLCCEGKESGMHDVCERRIAFCNSPEHLHTLHAFSLRFPRVIRYTLNQKDQ
jgi:hypothetical protein